MIRLLMALGVVMFLTLWFLGADHGQYINPPQPETPAVAAEEPAKRAVFLAAKPVVEPAPPVAQAATAPESTATAGQARPIDAVTKVMHAPAGASVRGGPGAEFPVVGQVAAGNVVMVVDDSSTPGWVGIAMDGSAEGWVAAKLLRE